MQISQRDIDRTLQFILSHFQRDITDCVKSSHVRRSAFEHRLQLHGLNLLFSDKPKISKLIESVMQEISYINAQIVYQLENPDGVGRSPVQPSGVVDQVTTQHDSKCTCDDCTCMGFGFSDALNEGSEFYPFVVGE